MNEASGHVARLSPVLVLGILCLLCGNSESLAEPQQLVAMDGAPLSGELLSIDSEGTVAFRIADRTEPLVIDAANLVRWGNPAPPRPQILVVLSGGGQLLTAANWSGSAAVQVKGNEVHVRSDVWDDVALTKAAVRGIVFAQRNRIEDRQKLAEQLQRDSLAEEPPSGSGPRSADIVYLTNGDRLTGNLEKIEGGSMSIMTSAGSAELPLSRVESIRLRPAAPIDSDSRATSAAAGLIIGTQDGSLLYARKIKIESSKVTVETDNGFRLVGAGVSDIAVVQSRGGHFAYLSDINTVDYRSVPYLNLEWPLARDQNVRGGTLTAGGKTYLKGLGMHSAARLTFKFEREYRRFDTEIAIDDAAKGRGSVVFGVYVQRDGTWNETYKSETVRGGEAHQAISVDLRGASGLTLTVDYADRGDELDYADWLDARFVH